MSEKIRDSIFFRIAMALAKILSPILPPLSPHLLGKILGTFFGCEDAIRIGKIFADTEYKRAVKRWQSLLEMDIELCNGFLSRHRLSGEERANLERIRSVYQEAINSLLESRETEMYDLHAAKMAFNEMTEWFESRRSNS